MGDSKNGDKLSRGWNTLGSDNNSAGGVDRQTALAIFSKLTVRNIKSNGAEFPQDIMVRFHGNEIVEFFQTKAVQPKFRRICTKEAAEFINNETPDTNGED